jgi:very-short-patch-repair endonuclease
VARWWAQLPMGRVVCLAGAGRAALLTDVQVLPEDAPAIIGYTAISGHSVMEMVTAALEELEATAVRLFPAWLPDARGLARPARRGGSGARAVRVLALRMAAHTPHYGPFLAELAETALCGQSAAGGGRWSRRFPREVRAAGLARVLAASFGRTHTAILVDVPEGLSAADEERFVAGCEWLAHAGGFGVWLTGAPLAVVDRVASIPVFLPHVAASDGDSGGARPGGSSVSAGSAPSGEPTVICPAVAGQPHPASEAEQTLEAALARHGWAAGRAWNQVHQSNPLVPPIRVDLLWRDERCVVEIDGDDHRRPFKFREDRRRDVQLQIDGYAVLRFTNDHVLHDTQAVVGQIQRFILKRRRIGTLEG